MSLACRTAAVWGVSLKSIMETVGIMVVHQMHSPPPPPPKKTAKKNQNANWTSGSVHADWKSTGPTSIATDTDAQTDRSIYPESETPCKRFIPMAEVGDRLSVVNGMFYEYDREFGRFDYC